MFDIESIGYILLACIIRKSVCRPLFFYYKRGIDRKCENLNIIIENV